MSAIPAFTVTKTVRALMCEANIVHDYFAPSGQHTEVQQTF